MLAPAWQRDLAWQWQGHFSLRNWRIQTKCLLRTVGVHIRNVPRPQKPLVRPDSFLILSTVRVERRSRVYSRWLLLEREVQQWTQPVVHHDLPVGSEERLGQVPSVDELWIVAHWQTVRLAWETTVWLGVIAVVQLVDTEDHQWTDPARWQLHQSRDHQTQDGHHRDWRTLRLAQFRYTAVQEQWVRHQRIQDLFEGVVREVRQ